MWSVWVVPGKTSFTNEDDVVQALKKMNEGHEDKGVDKEDNVEVAVANEDNDNVAKATEDKEKETVPDAEGGGDEPDGDGIAVSSGAGEGVMEPNGDGDRDLQTMDEGKSPTKADEEMVCTDAKERTKEEDEPMQEGEQGEAKPTEDVNDKPATPSDTSVAVAEEGKSDEAPKTNMPNKEALDATQKLWSSPPPQ